jgi:tetratricopeptide (TPR) repeat protein
MTLAQSSQSANTSDDPLTQHNRAAYEALTHGDHAVASAEYRAFLGAALHRVANARGRSGELDKAAAVFKEAVDFAPRDADLLADYAALQLDRGVLPEAEAVLNSAMQVAPARPRVEFLLGRALFLQDRFPAAKSHLESAFAHDPESAWFLLAITDLKLQQLHAAQQILTSMLGRLGDKASTHFRFGLAYYDGDFPDEAIGAFRKAIEQDPTALDQHYYLGLAYLGHNPDAGFARAEPEFRAELNLNPNDFRSHYMLGYIAWKQRDFSNAEKELKNTLAIKPDDPNTLLVLSEVCRDSERLAEAEPLLRRAIELYNRNAAENYELVSAHYMLGQILQRTGRSDDARKELTVSEEIRKRLRVASAATPEARSGMPLPQTGVKTTNSRASGVSAEEKRQAEEYVSRLSPAIADAYNNLGVIAASAGNFSEALAYFRRAGAWDRTIEGLDRNLARAAYLGQHYEEAVPALQRYLQKHPDDAWARQALQQSLKNRN